MKRLKKKKLRLKRLPASILLRGRTFTKTELVIIQRIAAAFFSRGRYRISIEVCKTLNWTQPNGWLKDRACRDVLRALDSHRYINLPKPKNTGRLYSKWQPGGLAEKTSPLQVTSVSARIQLELAKGNKWEPTWNALVQQYHYLGHRVTVGKCLKFLVRSGETILGAISLAECAWAIQDRDKALSQLGILKHEVADNNRFLLLPNVRIKCLASQVLSLLAREASREWKKFYSLELKCLETFIDSSRFEGTSYKAANWILVGRTKGFRKTGHHHSNGQTPKSIYLYPLDPKQRAQLGRQMSAIQNASGRE